MLRPLTFIIATALTLSACAGNQQQQPEGIPAIFLPRVVDVDIISDDNKRLPEFPVDKNQTHYRAYLLATKNQRYQIHITNNHPDRRIGVVIAVDGRNIISGQKSYLQNSERMYILNPKTTGNYDGWRTSANQVNRFYFTESSDSYAAAWGDHSAMGVIAIAVYEEKPRSEPPQVTSDMASPRASAEGLSALQKQAGTGFGETSYSPSVKVDFEPASEQASEKTFLKYEWQETLCQKQILSDCKPASQQPENRFWQNDDGFALPPPR